VKKGSPGTFRCTWASLPTLSSETNISISVVAFGERVEQLRLEEKPGGKTSGTGAFELPAVKGKMTFVADWRKKTLDADGSICGWAWTWQCTSIDKRIAFW